MKAADSEAVRPSILRPVDQSSRRPALSLTGSATVPSGPSSAQGVCPIGGDKSVILCSCLMAPPVNREIMVLRCVSTGGVPELHQSAAGEREQAVYLRNQRLHPHLHQQNGTASASLHVFNTLPVGGSVGRWEVMEAVFTCRFCRFCRVCPKLHFLQLFLKCGCEPKFPNSMPSLSDCFSKPNRRKDIQFQIILKAFCPSFASCL